MIKSIRHKGLRTFYETGNVRGIRPEHAERLRTRLTALDSAMEISDMELPGFGLHPLAGQMAGRWSVSISGNWRLTFEFHGGNAHVLEYEDYH
ncbi:MAG: type II toxin-antitoxin system RelE/ParE family toxin [Agromyces sp.]